MREYVRLRVVDAESPARLDARTRAFVGTQEWEPAEALFLVTAATRLIEVQVVREPTWKFDNQIAGTAWGRRGAGAGTGEGGVVWGLAAGDGVELVREPGRGVQRRVWRQGWMGKRRRRAWSPRAGWFGGADP